MTALPPELDPRRGRRPSGPRRTKSSEILRLVAIVVGAGALLGAVIGIALGQLFPHTTAKPKVTVPPQLRESATATAHASPTTKAAAPSASATTPSGAAPVKPTAVTAFDPSGDGHENDGDLPKLIDGDPATAWTTQHYSSAAFGGLKSGLGVLLDLGKPMHVAGVDVTPAWPGAAMQVRTSTTQSNDPAAYRAFSSPTTARYVLIWISSLPQHDGAYRAGIAEVKVTAAP